MKPKGGAERQTGLRSPCCSSRGWGCREQYLGVTGNQLWNSNRFPKCSPSSRRNFLRDRVCLGTQAAVTSAGDLGGILRPLDPGAQEMGSAESTEQTAPGGIQPAWGFPMWKCRENNAPGCVRGGGLPLLRSPGEQLHVDREF